MLEVRCRHKQKRVNPESICHKYPEMVKHRSGPKTYLILCYNSRLFESEALNSEEGPLAQRGGAGLSAG